jgi:hypothetical protein
VETTLSQGPVPGWYADPQGFPVYRWWDGNTWTAHTTDAQPLAPAAQQAYAPTAQEVYGRAVAAPARTAPYRPATQTGGAQRNQYAFITMGIVALYVLVAWKAHVYILGILPVMMSIRSKSRGEPLAVVAFVAAAVAVVVAIAGFTHH